MKSQYNVNKWLSVILFVSLLMTPTLFASSAPQIQFERSMQMALNIWYSNHTDADRGALHITGANGTGAIEGTVQEDVQPIEGALVYAWSVLGATVVTQSAVTDSDGSYRLENLQAGEYYVVASAEGYMPAFYGDGQSPMDAEMVSVADGETTTDININLQKAAAGDGAISGVVTAEGDGPLAGAWVMAFNQNNPFNAYNTFAVSNDNGEYKIANLPTGIYFVIAYANGYIPEIYDNTTSPLEATPVIVNNNEVTGIDFALAKGGSISGHVQDNNGDPIANVDVSALSFDSQTPGGLPGLDGMMQMAVTDENGNYTIYGLPPGDYIVAAMLITTGNGEIKYWNDKDSFEEADVVSVGEGEEVIGIDFTFTLPTAKISGVVTDSDGSPLKNIFIYYVREEENIYYNFGCLWKSAITDENGYYELDHLPAGTYYVSAWYWDYMNFKGVWYENADSLQDATPIVLADGEVRDDINMTLDLTTDYGAITGKVTLDDSGDPVAYAFVEAVPLESPVLDPWDKRLPTAYAFTDAEGNYKLKPVYKGEYHVVVRVNNYVEYFDDKTSWDEADVVAVEAGQETPNINFGVPGMPTDGSMVSGVVTNESTGAPIEGALVAVFPTLSHNWFNGDMSRWTRIYYTTFTDANGAYKIGGIPEGEYVASAWARDYVGEFYDDVYDPFQAEILKLDGENSLEDINFALTPRQGVSSTGGPGEGVFGSIGGVIHSNSGAPVEGAFVYALDENNNIVASEISGADGGYSLDGLEEGTYTVMASRSLYETTYYPDATDIASATPIELDSESSLNVPDAAITMASGEITGVHTEASKTTPSEFSLLQNYPNPFNPSTTIEYHVPKNAHVTLKIFNTRGRLVATLVNENQAAQSYKVVWDGRDMNGSLAPSGVYFYQLQANDYTETKTLLFIK